MSLYLKYRPQDFDNLVGQDFIKNTLKKALDAHKIVSSYLFCGPRGTGKTSTARLLAKGMNCQNLVEGNPCNSCENCEAFHGEKLIDIIEIDAASHTGVDNIREIIERAQFRPTKAQFKVYIIDEVHMLSKGAFNALLKILEEPPSHVKFILATTETHKVPDTIISRCQRYDFQSIDTQDIIARLQYIAEKEGITIDEVSLEYISRNAKGGLRNAISLFEQLVDNNEIHYKDIVEKLGITDNDVLEKVYNSMLEGTTSCIYDVQNLASTGKNMSVFFTDLLAYAKTKLLENIESSDVSTRIYITDVLHEGVGKMKYSHDPELVIIIMMTKIIGSYTTVTPVIEARTIQSSVHENSLVENASVSSVHTQENQGETNIVQETVSHNDIQDIFGGEDTPSDVPVNSKKSPGNNNDFDSEKYIETLKSLKVKGALIISLKQARNFSLKDDYLEIVLQNNFTLKAMNSGENIVQLIQGLEKMGIEGKTVKLS